jgi:hypothetical protein
MLEEDKRLHQSVFDVCKDWLCANICVFGIRKFYQNAALDSV